MKFATLMLVSSTNAATIIKPMHMFAQQSRQQWFQQWKHIQQKKKQLMLQHYKKIKKP